MPIFSNNKKQNLDFPMYTLPDYQKYIVIQIVIHVFLIKTMKFNINALKKNKNYEYNSH